MHTSSSTLINALRHGSSLRAKARVIAEWNHNSHTTISDVGNSVYPEATYGYDLQTFPIKSIVEPRRPTSGIAFAKTDESKVSQYNGDPSVSRYLTVDDRSKYKYWTSPYPSDAAKYIGGTCNPYVIYADNIWTNKIHLCFDTSWAKPVGYFIQITEDAVSWTTIAENIVPDSKGVVDLYLQGDSSWGTSTFRSSATVIRGIRIYVYTMNVANAHLNLIEMGARLENDLSSYLINYSINNELSNSDFVSPLGTISSNTGSVTLSNIDGRFDTDNVLSLYYGLIDANVKFTVYCGIDTSFDGGSEYEYVRQATMYSETWDSSEEKVTISLKDGSKHLQEIKPLAMLMENVTISQAIWRILDSVGFSDYFCKQLGTDAQTIIPFYWTDPEETVWGNIQDICRALQTAAYFDEYGILRVTTRTAMFDKSATVPVWSLDSKLSGTEQPDIISVSSNSNFEVNKVTVNYKPTALSTDTQNRAVTELTWQPDKDVVLRSSPLAYDMTATQMDVVISQPHAVLWPFKGMMNIRGEFIKYEGKQYQFINKSWQWEWKTIFTLEEQYNVDNNLTLDNKQIHSFYNGRLFITERGVDFTVAEVHTSTIDTWVSRGFHGTSAMAALPWTGGIIHYPADGLLRLITHKGFSREYFGFAIRDTPAYAEPNAYFGTRFRFPSSTGVPQRSAGLFFNASTDMRSMYIVDVMSTAEINAGPRSYRDEIAVIKRTPAGNVYLGRGVAMAIIDDTWMDLDVQKIGATISVRFNGSHALTVSDNSIPASWLQGLNVRGFTAADFEYYYTRAFSAGFYESAVDNSTDLDMRRGGYYSNQFYKDFNYNERTWTRKSGAKTITYKQAYGQRVFDEFGMQVHEIRQFKVKFEMPVLQSSLYMSNLDQTVTTEYIHSPFGADFIIANASRTHAVANGEDLSLGASVSQKMMVTGRTVQQKDEVQYKVEDKNAIITRGEVSLDFSSNWIQTADAAKAMGDWIVSNWSRPNDEIEVETFGNPLLQIGDIVSMNHAPKSMSPSTHKYWVLKVKQDWNNGPGTSLTLRRARI